MHKKIKHVFFDLDHTLWDFYRNSGLTFEKIFKIHNLEVNLKDFLKAYEAINFKYWKLYREEQVTKSKLRYGRLKDTFTEINTPISDDIINKLATDYIEYLTTFNHLFDDTIAILDYLKQNYQLHIITNGFEEAQDRKLINSKIKHYFATVTNSEMVGVKKPNPKIFKFALQLANAKVEESIMIGDSLEADILGAQNFGMDAILFDYKNQHPKINTKRVQKLAQIETLL